MRIATFNINGIKARLPRLLEWLAADRADIVCLQEIKCQDETFPREAFTAAGWQVETHGQKGFNGVAILAKAPIAVTRRGLPAMSDDDQARYIEAEIDGLRVASLYLPNGNPQPGPKFEYKLRWFDRLIAHAKALLAEERPVVLAGDYNVIPEADDAAHPDKWTDDALFQPESRAAFRTLRNLGYVDAIRYVRPSESCFTFWDYQAGAWQRDNGIRIDHLMLSPQAADRLADARVDREPRGKEKASDHTPALVSLD
ncbi:MAG: exodeoxyribonuclease III [Rhodothalassiaceae bacterium]